MVPEGTGDQDLPLIGPPTDVDARGRRLMVEGPRARNKSPEILERDSPHHLETWS